MVHTDINEPRIRDERSALICMNCGGINQPTARCNGTTDKKQAWCDKCRASAKAAKERRQDEEKMAAIELREQQEVLRLMHERGRHAGGAIGPVASCPCCQDEAAQ